MCRTSRTSISHWTSPATNPVTPPSPYPSPPPPPPPPPPGAAYLHLHMATTLHADSPEQRSHHLTKALDLLRPSLEHLHGDKTVTFLCGSSGPLALGTIVCDLLGRREDADRCVGRLRSLYLEHKKSFTSMPSELLFGHVGYLYSLLYVNSYLPRTIEESLIAEVCKWCPDPTWIIV